MSNAVRSVEESRHGHRAVGRQAVLDHRLVARLEDVERERCSREEDPPGRREHRKCCKGIPEGRVRSIVLPRVA
ncbi:MAG: hypothetical protein RMJ98_02790 [Myxococcales bacterium]|nr:hypothetical protein [Polyangiaceae bacterium]MDW8248217.1 hypothetical protein [Myxococcales bacterium]